MQITRDNKRSFTIETSRKVLKTPFFFPSISTVKTNHKIWDYFNLLKKVSYPGFLISSYDIYKDEKKELLIKEISEISEMSIFTLMDSGNYESYWNNDAEWTIKQFESILKEITVDLCLSFDVFWEDGKNIQEHIKETIKYTAITASMQKLGTTIPIIHSDPENFPQIVNGVVEGISPQIIGITERELGASLIERGMNLKKIRDELDKIRTEVPIHLLGTGNPISLLVYTLCGGDLFDALEWCKNVVNPENGHLYHFAQKDLIKCNCKACRLDNIPYHLQTMSHNLIFYETFTEEIRQAIKKDEILGLLNKYLPKHIIPKVMEISGIK